MRLKIEGTTDRLVGQLDVPVSKYHAHRALMLAALAPGVSRISGRSRTRQVDWTVQALRHLGVQVDVHEDGYVVHGVGGHFAVSGSARTGAHPGVIDIGSSGTTLYFLAGLVCLAETPTTVTGMKYVQNRPIRALLQALLDMGVDLHSERGDWCIPVQVQPGRPAGGDVSIKGTLSQWVSGLLILAPFAQHDTTVHIVDGPLNERTYVDLTIRMMRHWGFTVEADEDYRTFHVPAGQQGHAADYTIPADIGASAFGIAVAAIHPSDVLFRGQTAITAAEADHPEADFLDIAASMGIDMRRDEKTGFLRVRSEGSPLAPFEANCRDTPDLLPVLATMASFAEGTSKLTDVGHVRLKECDRVAAMLQLNRLGGNLEQDADELRITGTSRAPLHGAELSSFNDHRVLMSLAVAATCADSPSTLTYPRAYRISYPAFLEQMNGIGLNMSVIPSSSVHGTEDEPTPIPAAAPAAHRVARHISAEEMLVLPNRVRSLARAHANESAVIEVGGGTPVSTSWSQLQAQADKVSSLLLELGVRPGESVALQLPNWVEFVAVTLGIIQIGAVVTPIMPVFGAHEIAKILTRSRARIVFIPSAFRHQDNPGDLLAAAKEPEADLHVKHVIVVRADTRTGRGAATKTSPVPAEAMADTRTRHWTWRYYREALATQEPPMDDILDRVPDPDDPCQLLFTSGTTGEPKGVLMAHRPLSTAVSMEIEHLGLDSDDRIYVPTPMAHQTGFLYGLLLSWRLGVASVIQPVWDATIALDQAFALADATFVQAATPFLADTVAAVKGGKVGPDSLRIFVATGAAVPRVLAKEATDVLRASVLGAFGTTESCLGALATPTDPPEDAWGSDGRALPGIELRIRDDEGHELPAGQEGNFEIHTPTLFEGYLDRPELTTQVYTEDGWFRTGDLAILDEHGFLHITGRVKDVINRGGEKIPVVEIENLLFQHPMVADAAIVAMPDPRLGERACAFVVASGQDKLGFEQMKDYLGERGLSKYYWPERLEYIDALPRNAVGKVQKNVLREQAKHLTVERSK
ncbi:3-phosphoshikimate 1-carboxyvinyltransferase [Propionibacterium sp.]|uniref:3-phosphoshikimate 1-carboxyvinyltransferase n=1 Tax=Propionibacterium sp. TaxID=1977903 RepID=UPI0039EC0B70